MTTPPSSNPRRCFKTRAPPTSLSCRPTPTHHAADSSQPTEPGSPLKKSSTFHCSSPPPREDDPIINIPLLSKRSPTSHKDLEDAVSAGQQRIANLIGHLDRSLSGLASFSSDSQKTPRPDDLPVPRFMIDAHVTDPSHMDVDKTELTKLAPRRKHHSSDSGIGSTVTASDDLHPAAAGKRQDHPPTITMYPPTHTSSYLDGDKSSVTSIIKEVQTGINGNNSVTAGATGLHHALSAYACRQIQKYIIVPILKEKSLKDFHPLVKGIPIRVGRKEITCLRDLEKVLLWLAPVSGFHQIRERRLAHGCSLGVQRFSASRSSFVRFGETTIQCLHTTVPHLNETDLKRPSDRPYTNGYFLDLTEQVRQYAAMITEARERIASGESKEEDPTRYGITDYQPGGFLLTLDSNEHLVLHGGLRENGRPAELARYRDGTLISLRTGEPIDVDAESPPSVTFASQAEREEFELSMARRRKNASERIVHRCSECDKEFKRPCDLTKHEKTHSRPWKCSESSCKYSHYGWPTEKERDRHMNDKHSAAPSMYKCQYHPCPYESKRESNCKQHMEKAHGWAYVRSKNNGKNGKKPTKSADKSPPTPQITPGSNIFERGSDFGDPLSPYARTHSRATSTATGSINESSPYLGVTDNAYPPFDPNFNWDPQQRLTPASTPYTPVSHDPSMDPTSAQNMPAVPSSSYGTSMEEIDPPLFNGTFDWSNMDMDTDFTNMNIQLFTPAASIEGRPLDAYDSSRNPSISLDAPIKNLNLSPGAEGGATLYSPYEHQTAVDEGYHEFATTDLGKPAGDFALFDSRPTSSLSQQGNMNMFSDLPPFQPTTWHPQGQSQSFNMEDLMES